MSLSELLKTEGLTDALIKVAVDAGWSLTTFKHAADSPAELEKVLPEIFGSSELSRLQVAQICGLGQLRGTVLSAVGAKSTLDNRSGLLGGNVRTQNHFIQTCRTEEEVGGFVRHDDTFSIKSFSSSLHILVPLGRC